MIVEKPKIVFFGTPEFSVKILEAMDKAGLKPKAIVTAPDKPKGRKMELTPSHVKIWGDKHKIKVLQPEKLKDFKINADLFVVASYGKILPKTLLESPKHGTINVHPSLLPRLRGPSPIQSAILKGEEKTGMTIIKMNEKMDEGAMLAQKEIDTPINITTYKILEDILAKLGGKMLVEVIPKWINGEIDPEKQDHAKATYCRMINKRDGEIKKDDPLDEIDKKIRALNPWPGIYTFSKGKRIIIVDASLRGRSIEIKRVKPEGKKEMDYKEYLKGNPPII